ncbi:MAG: class I SAM-dependent methyltransferase [Spirochaetia bacterium]|nr:class I SAM-dependent methyltransferase [Spirochaetia bacterium]
MAGTRPDALELRAASLLPPASDGIGASNAGGSSPRAPSPPALSRARLAAVGKALLRLQRGLTGGRALVGAPYMDDPALLEAYLLYYWPVSYAQAARALALSKAGTRKRVLDLGSGPGPVAAAFADSGARELVLVDASREALSLAQRILENPPEGLAPQGPPRVETLAADLEGLSPDRLPPGPYDAVSFGHSLNELWKGLPDRVARRAGLLESLRSRVAPGGLVLVVEPALLATSRDAIALRDALLERAWSVVAPCPAPIPCPALAAGPSHTCHDAAPWDVPPVTAALAREAGLDRDELKAAWFALSPDRAPSAAPEGFRRVVSEPMLNKSGRVRYLLCDARGRVALSAKSGDPAAKDSGFFALERYDLARVTGAEARETGEGVVAGTVIERVEE